MLIKLHSHSSRQIWRQASAKIYNVQPDWSNQIITIYLIGQSNPWSDMISFRSVEWYHITSRVSFLFMALSHWYHTHHAIKYMGMQRYGISLQVFNSISHGWEIELNTRREIPYLQATIYYFVNNYYITILLRRRSQLNSCFEKRTHCHSFMALNRVSDFSAADWLSQNM